MSIRDHQAQGRRFPPAMPMRTATSTPRRLAPLTGRSIASARWLLLGVFVVGALSCPLATDARFLAFNAASLLALALLLTRLKQIESLWVWMPLGVFVQGYYIKTYRTAIDMASPDFIDKYGGEYLWLTPDALVRGLGWTTLSFSIFCVTAWLLLGMSARAGADAPLARLTDARRGALISRATQIGVAVFLLCLLACAAQAYLGFGTMGVVGSRPGFGLAVVIVRFRTEVGPTLLLLVLWVLEECKSRRSMLVVAMFVAMAIADAFLRTSRGSLILYMVPLVLLWALTHRLTSWRLGAGVIALALTAILVPFITAIRMERISYSMGLLDSVEAAFNDTKDTFLDPSASSAEHVVTRVSGAEGVWFSLDAAAQPLPLAKVVELVLTDDFGEYFTRNVWGVSMEGDFRAPGLVGSSMVLGGDVAVVALTIGFVVMLGMAWRLLAWTSTPTVLKAFAGNMVLFLTSENPFSYKHVVGIVLTCLIVEFLWRILFAPLVSEPTTGGRRLMGVHHRTAPGRAP